MGDLIAFILELYLDIKHWFKVKRRRKFEKENNLPKKYIWHPLDKLFLISFLLIIITLYLRFFFFSKNKYERYTKQKLDEIAQILNEEKKEFGKFPKELKEVIRNNPLRKKIHLDFYENEFIYKLSKDYLNYTIIAIGKDQKFNTKDDLLISSKN